VADHIQSVIDKEKANGKDTTAAEASLADASFAPMPPSRTPAASTTRSFI